MPNSKPLLAQDPPRDFLSLCPIEDPDWGYARNKRCVLMAPSAEWVQSVYSAQFELNGKKFIAPNRDYPYEGLLVHQNGENWKFIDCIALALEYAGGQGIPFVIDPAEPLVNINPWRVTYCYKITGFDFQTGKKDQIPFFVSYYLNSKNKPELITGCVELYFPKGLVCGGGEIVPIIQPFIDIRHMYFDCEINRYDWQVESKAHHYRHVYISNRNRTLVFYMPYVELVNFQSPEILEWRYKLGAGARTERAKPNDQNSETVFVGASKKVVSFFNLRVPNLERILGPGQNVVRLFWACGLDKHPRSYLVSNIEQDFQKSRAQDSAQFRLLEETFPIAGDARLRDAILARIIGLIKFKTYVHFPETKEYIPMPYAGAWWFKTPWYRDVFEGILSSFETLMKLPEERESIKKIVWAALREQHKGTGRILNRILEFRDPTQPGKLGDYNAADGTLLCFVTANAYIKKTGDLDFALELLPHYGTLIACFHQDNAEFSTQDDGPPRVDAKTGLLLSVPWHSWMDTRSQLVQCDDQQIAGLPSRLSEEFIRKLFDRLQGCFPDKEKFASFLSSPNFYLPEINAQWIVMLRGTLETLDWVAGHRPQQKVELPGQVVAIHDLRAMVEKTLRLAESNFKSVFWNKDYGFVYNVVYQSGNESIRDPLECEAAITAAAMLGETIFTQQELASVWRWAETTLLVKRRLVEYGLERYGSTPLPFGLLTRNVTHGVYYDDAQYHSDVTWPRSTPYLIKLLGLLNRRETVEELLMNNLDHQMTEAALFYNQELFSRPEGNNPQRDARTGDNPVPVKNPIQFWSQWCDAFVEFFGERKA